MSSTMVRSSCSTLYPSVIEHFCHAPTLLQHCNQCLVAIHCYQHCTWLVSFSPNAAGFACTMVVGHPRSSVSSGTWVVIGVLSRRAEPRETLDGVAWFLDVSVARHFFKFLQILACTFGGIHWGWGGIHVSIVAITLILCEDMKADC